MGVVFGVAVAFLVPVVVVRVDTEALSDDDDSRIVVLIPVSVTTGTATGTGLDALTAVAPVASVAAVGDEETLAVDVVGNMAAVGLGRFVYFRRVGCVVVPVEVVDDAAAAVAAVAVVAAVAAAVKKNEVGVVVVVVVVVGVGIPPFVVSFNLHR